MKEKNPLAPLMSGQGMFDDMHIAVKAYGKRRLNNPFRYGSQAKKKRTKV